ncbi:hypothetical protein CDIMF43_50054 [Carnobacterium divergens]|nr:hypothetical protein CDIMF43_50054 [Carnobacterium divergens]
MLPPKLHKQPKSQVVNVTHLLDNVCKTLEVSQETPECISQKLFVLDFTDL